MPPDDTTRAYFDDLYACSDDPYGMHARWYERRKRAVLHDESGCTVCVQCVVVCPFDAVRMVKTGPCQSGPGN